jgi:hypothetical protein
MDNLQFNPITERTWLDCYYKLWNEQSIDNIREEECVKLTENCVGLIKMKEMETIIQTLKCRESPGSDGIKNKFFKHAPKTFYINS